MIIKNKEDFNKIFVSLDPKLKENIHYLEDNFPGTLEEITKTGKLPKQVESYLTDHALTAPTKEGRQWAMDVLNGFSTSFPNVKDVHKEFLNNLIKNSTSAESNDYRIANELANLRADEDMQGRTLTKEEVTDVVAKEYAKRTRPNGEPTPEDYRTAQGFAEHLMNDFTSAPNDKYFLGNYENQLREGKYADAPANQAQIAGIKAILGGKQEPSKESTDLQKQIQDLSAQYQKKTEAEQATNDYLSALPGELTKNREELLKNQENIGQQTFEQEATPLALETANVRGALYSGDVPDLLTTSAYGIQSQLDEARTQAEAEDNQFYFNAAYSNMARRALEANVNLGSFIQNERNQAVQEQQNRFTNNQGSLNRNLNDYLTQKEYERNLRIQDATARRQEELYNRQQKNALYGKIGHVGGKLVGAGVGMAVGGPGGAVVGSEVGGEVVG